VAAVDDVGAGFAGPGGGVDVGGEAAGGLAFDELAAVGGLGQELIAGGEVAEQGGAGEGECAARGLHRPEVLAELDPDHAIGEVVGAEEEVGAEGDLLAEQLDLPYRGDPGRGEPALLVELPGVRQVGLRHDAQDLAARKEDPDVEEAAGDLERQSDQGREPEAAGGLGDLAEGLQGAGEEGALAEEVPATVPG